MLRSPLHLAIATLEAISAESVVDDGWQKGVLFDDLFETDHALIVEDLVQLAVTSLACLPLHLAFFVARIV